MLKDEEIINDRDPYYPIGPGIMSYNRPGDIELSQGALRNRPFSSENKYGVQRRQQYLYTKNVHPDYGHS